jgi:hypothetical protein
VPGSTGRLSILGTDPTNQLQIGEGFTNNSILINGIGKISMGTSVPQPSTSLTGPDVLIQNATPSTGSTLVQIQAGAGQSGDLMQWMSSGGGGGTSVSAQGALRNLPFGAQPACDSTSRGMFWHAQGGTGATDSVTVCAKNSADTYAWRTIF